MGEGIRISDVRASKDDNLLDDMIGSKDQVMFDKLLSADDFEVHDGMQEVQV